MAADMEARFKELEAKVRELTDREALRDLRYRYHECINEGKFAEIPSLFTADADLDFGALGKARGREQLVKFFGAMDMTSPEAGKSPLRVSSRRARVAIRSSSADALTRPRAARHSATTVPSSRRFSGSL